VLDLFSRFVVGWAISAVNDRRLTLKAPEMAVARRCPDSGLLHHWIVAAPTRRPVDDVIRHINHQTVSRAPSSRADLSAGAFVGSSAAGPCSAATGASHDRRCIEDAAKSFINSASSRERLGHVWLYQDDVRSSTIRFTYLPRTPPFIEAKS
jgi:hypothetical protein